MNPDIVSKAVGQLLAELPLIAPNQLVFAPVPGTTEHRLMGFNLSLRQVLDGWTSPEEPYEMLAHSQFVEQRNTATEIEPAVLTDKEVDRWIEVFRLISFHVANGRSVRFGGIGGPRFGVVLEDEPGSKLMTAYDEFLLVAFELAFGISDRDYTLAQRPLAIADRRITQ